jgi:hypothetical protein
MSKVDKSSILNLLAGAAASGLLSIADGESQKSRGLEVHKLNRRESYAMELEDADANACGVVSS